MAEHDRGELLGYLLGALEPDEEQAIEERLARDPDLRQELTEVRVSLAALRAAPRDHVPPPGLAQRTCQLLALCTRPRTAANAPRADLPRAKKRRRLADRMSTATLPPTAPAAWSWSDLAVTISVVLLVALALFPAIQEVRNHAQLSACQDNLRRIGVHYTQLTQQHPRRLPNALRQPRAMSAGYSPGRSTADNAGWRQNLLMDDGRVLLICTGTQLIAGDAFPSFNADIPPLVLSNGQEMPPITLVRGPR